MRSHDDNSRSRGRPPLADARCVPAQVRLTRDEARFLLNHLRASSCSAALRILVERMMTHNETP